MYSNAWLIKKVGNDEGKWYWGWCNLDGDEWDDLEQMQADLYLTISIPKTKS